MSFDASEIETRVLTLERKILRLREGADELSTWRVAASEQQLAMLWAAGSRRCTTTINGKIIGGDTSGIPLPNSTLQVLGHATGADYGTYSLALGTYSLALSLDPSDSFLDLVATGPGIRFRPTIATNVFVTQCATNNLAAVQATPNNGYFYQVPALGPGPCQFPIGPSLNFNHSIFGTGTMSSSPNPWQAACQNLASFADPGSGCPARTATAVRLGMSVLEEFLLNFFGGGNCPANVPCPGGSSGSSQVIRLSGLLITSKTCPDASTTKFDCTWTIPANTETVFHGPTAATMRIYEP